MRPRKAPRVQPREMTLHLAVADILRRHCLPNWRWSHFPSGEARDVRVGAKLKRMGLQRGWADFVLVAPKGGRFHGLELKRPGEDLTDDQEAWQKWAIANGVAYSVAWNVNDALAILSDWGCLQIRLSRQPDDLTGGAAHFPTECRKNELIGGGQ